jgi:hypothetical protein
MHSPTPTILLFVLDLLLYLFLSVVGDNDVDCYLYNFVVWCQKHYPCNLYDCAELVSAEDLLLEEEVIPSID